MFKGKANPSLSQYPCLPFQLGAIFSQLQGEKEGFDSTGTL
jgi:hypothetical protein